MKIKKIDPDQVDFSTFRIWLEQISFLKKKLNKRVEELKPLRTKYIRYLEKNPYKDRKVELEREVEKLREDIIANTPNGE